MTSPLTTPNVTCPDGLWRGDWSDGYRLIIKQLDAARIGACRAELEVHQGDVYVTTLTVDFLSPRSQDEFAIALSGRNGVAPVVWTDRLSHFYRELRRAQQSHPAALPWDQALTIDELLRDTDDDIPAMVRDLVMPGAISLFSAHRGAGKSIFLSYLAIALARGGIFRGDRLPQKRVFLVDRDNPKALVRRRFRDFGGHGTADLRILTRDHAPTLTEKDRALWDHFPVEDYDVVVIDSISAATEGVSEKEGKQTQEWLAILKDLAMRGPAVIGLANTDKAGTNIRGRGEITNAVDIIYECRNITGWTPTEPGDWWEHLPDFGEHAWQQRASRRKGQPVLQIAFIPSKFRLGVDPEPFVLEVDTREDPWTLDDITEDIASAGQQAAADAAQRARATLLHAEAALVQALRTRPPDHPMLKREAEHFLSAQGLRQRVAGTLLTQGGNRDLYPTGSWVLRAIPGARGGAIGVYLAGEEDRERNNQIPKSPHDDTPLQPSISFTGATPCEQNTATTNASKYADETGAAFRSQCGYTMNEIDTHSDKEICASPDRGIISFTDTPSSEDPCLHEHVNDFGACNDCGRVLDERS